MSKTIQVADGYYVSPRYITLEDDEELCPVCHGMGKTTIVYRDPGPNVQGTCWECEGIGKRKRKEARG